MTKKEIIKKGDVNYMKKTLSLVLAVLMIMATMPVVFAAEQEKLTKDNITQYPTLVYREETGNAAANTIFYGQTFGEAAYFVGGTVLNSAGEEVDGEFVWYSSVAVVPVTKAETNVAIKFVPSDKTAYSTISMTSCQYIKYTCIKTTPVAIENQTPLTATAIDAGQMLSKSIISGGEMCNPYNATEKKIAAATWSWQNPDQIITESGNYTAVFCPSTNYNEVTAEIYVEVNSYKTQTEIVYPSGDKTISIPYDGVTTMADLEANANALDVYAVEKGTDTRVAGTFTIVQGKFETTFYRGLLTISKNNAYKVLQLVFTPEDTEKYSGVETTEPVTLVVTKATPAWTSGETLVLTYDYGTSPFNTHGGQIKELDATNLNCYVEGTNQWQYQFDVYDLDKNPVTLKASDILDAGEYDYLLKVSHSAINDNWDTQNTYLPVKIVIAPANAEMQDFSYSYVSGEIKGNYGNLYLNGSVDITIGDDTIEDVAVTQGRFTANWTPADTKNDADYDVTVKYTAADGDNAVVESDYTGTISYKTDRNIILKHKQIDVSTKGNPSFINENDYLITGTAVTIRATRDDFAYWVITDASGNEIELDITSGKITDKTFTFTMPAYDITINAVFQYQLDEQAKLDECECLCHSDNQLVQFFWNIILKIMDIFSKLFGYESVCDCGFAHGTENAF